MSDDGVDRRGFIRLSASGAVALLVGCDDDGATRPVDASTPDASALDAAAVADAAADQAVVDQGIAPEVFPTALIAGSMETTTALLCAQVDGPAEVQLSVWPAGQPDAPALVSAVAPDEGYVKVELVNLNPNTAYVAQLDAGGVLSPVARFRTAPEPGDLTPVTVAATSCTKWNSAPYVVLERQAEDDFDVLLHLGDMSYNDGADSLAEYRRKWRRTLADPGYRAVFAKAGMYATWDDHEIFNNVAGEASVPPALLAMAKRAFFEALPIERREDDRFWRSFRWGDTAEFFVLDSRLERQPETRETEAAIYLSEAQFDWLTQALAESPCHFKVVLTSVPITELPEVWPAIEDRWQGYASQRRALLDHLAAQAINNVWFLAGDFHFGAVIRVEPVGSPRNYWEILCGPAASTGNPVALLVDDPDLREQWTPADRFEHFSGQWATTTLTFDPAADTVRVRFADGLTGEVLYDDVLRAAEA